MMCTSCSSERPIIILDVMDTIVKDPFFEEMPRFFNMPFKQLLQDKHPTAWVEFECGLISEQDLYIKFFKDGRTFDHQGLKKCMVSRIWHG